MNVRSMNETRELTTAEVDEVIGGSILQNAIRTAWMLAYADAWANCEGFACDLHRATLGNQWPD
jgi:hypothetical protein